MPKKILVVDHDPSSLVKVSSLAEQAGYQPVGFQKANLALEYIDRPDAKDVCMIIADMIMPGSDGFSFLQAVKQKPNVQLMPFLFLSEVNDTAVLINAYEHGAVDYFIKPIKKEALFIAKIKSMAGAFEQTRVSANTLLAGHVGEKPLEELMAFCEHESLNGFLKIMEESGRSGMISFLKGQPETMAIFDQAGKITLADTEAFDQMSGWKSAEFIIRRGQP